jgi:hypothetical protein
MSGSSVELQHSNKRTGDTVAPDLLSTLLGWLETLAPAFTKPGFRNAVIVLLGWVQTQGVHAVTQALVATGVAGRRHHEAFHRFFSRGTWSPDAVGRLLLTQIVGLFPEDAVLDLVLDDTLAPKKGPKVFGIGNHLDPVRSTRRVRIFTFGHVWVVLSVVVRLPFSRRAWALPVLFRLYRTKKDCARRRTAHRKKTELAREMLDLMARWLPDRNLRVAMDNAYCNSTVLHGLHRTLRVVGAMRPDAALTSTPAAHVGRGRRRVRGEPLPSPLQLAKNRHQRWQRCTAFLYGRQQTVHFKTCDAQWYRVTGPELVRVVVVRVDHGDHPLRVFFSTDPTLSVIEILETYAGRWSIEVCFRDLKQLLGFADSQARKRTAVERTAPFVGFTYTILVLWFADEVWRSPLAAPPRRPWYRHKQGLCFADILRCAQRIMPASGFLDPDRDLDDLLENARSRHQPPPREAPLAA